MWEGLGELEAPPFSAPRLPSLLEAFGDPFRGEASAFLERGAEKIRKTACLREIRDRIVTCKSRVAALRRRRCAVEELAALEGRLGVSALSPETKRALQQVVYAMAGTAGVAVRQAKGGPGCAGAAARPGCPRAPPVTDRRAANRASAVKTRKRRRVWLQALQNRDMLGRAVARLVL